MKKLELKNIVASFGSQLMILVLGLIVPRIILVNYGSDTNGLTNTIVQIFTYLALLQSGISQAAKNALYKPIQQNNQEEISLIVSATKVYFERVSFYYSVIVLIISFLLPFILKTSVGYWTIFTFVLFEGATGVIEFYYINTWTSLLTATGKDYIKNSIELIGKTSCYLVKIVLAIWGVNIAFIQVGYFCVSLIKTLMYKRYIEKNFAWVNCSIKPKNYKLPDRNSYIVTEIAYTIFSSTDMIVLSTFVSTTLSSVYSIYNMVYTSINALLNGVYNSVNYKLGLVYNTDRKQYIKLHDCYQSIFMGAITILMSVSYILIIPFIDLYTNSVQDTKYIYSSLPMMFCLVQMFSWSRYVSGSAIGISGNAKKVIKISVIEATLNILLSIILVQKYSIVGVLFATVVVLPFKVIYSIYLSDVVVLKRKIYRSISILGINYVIFLLITILSKEIQLQICSIFDFAIYGLFLTLIMSIIVILLNMIVNKDLMKYFMKIFCKLNDNS